MTTTCLPTPNCGNNRTKQYSVLAANKAPVGTAFKASFEQPIPLTNGHRTLTPLGAFREGFDPTVIAPSFPPNALTPFELPKQTELTGEAVGEVISDWSRQIGELRACTEQQHDNGDISDNKRNIRMAVLGNLEEAVQIGFQPLKNTFNAYADQVDTVILDR